MFKCSLTRPQWKSMEIPGKIILLVITDFWSLPSQFVFVFSGTVLYLSLCDSLGKCRLEFLAILYNWLSDGWFQTLNTAAHLYRQCGRSCEENDMTLVCVWVCVHVCVFYSPSCSFYIWTLLYLRCKCNRCHIDKDKTPMSTRYQKNYGTASMAFKNLCAKFSKIFKSYKIYLVYIQSKAHIMNESVNLFWIHGCPLLYNYQSVNNTWQY